MMVAANYLDAPGAFSAAARQLNTRFLAGKTVEELRTSLGAEDDMSQAEQAAALAEPAFTPQPQEPAEESTAGPPCPQRGVSLLAGPDVLEAMLQQADAAALCQLKAVSVAWRTRARRELCNRLCRREGQPKPTGLASITDLDVEGLALTGRPWEVVVAGRESCRSWHGCTALALWSMYMRCGRRIWIQRKTTMTTMMMMTMTTTMATTTMPRLVAQPCAAASGAREIRHESCFLQLWPARRVGRCAGFLCRSCGMTTQSTA